MSKDAQNLTHSELERELEKRGLELMRSLLQAHLDVRGPGEVVGPVEGSDGVTREQERLHERGLETIFGEVKTNQSQAKTNRLRAAMRNSRLGQRNSP